jgi:hypothetical protein
LLFGGGRLLLSGDRLLLGGYRLLFSRRGLLLGLGHFGRIVSFDDCGGHDGGPAANAEDRVCFGHQQSNGAEDYGNLKYSIHMFSPAGFSGWYWWLYRVA